MAKIEIDEHELAELRRYAGLAREAEVKRRRPFWSRRKDIKQEAVREPVQSVGERHEREKPTEPVVIPLEVREPAVEHKPAPATQAHGHAAPIDISGLPREVQAILRQYPEAMWPKIIEHVAAGLGSSRSSTHHGGDLHRMLRDAGYMDEGIAQLLAFMERNHISDVREAMRQFDGEHLPPAPTVSGGPRGMGMMMPAESNARDAEADLRRLMAGDEEGFLGPAIAAALASVRGQR